MQYLVDKFPATFSCKHFNDFFKVSYLGKQIFWIFIKDSTSINLEAA